jgi:hypothetical protein
MKSSIFTPCSAISQVIELVILNAVKTSDPTYTSYFHYTMTRTILKMADIDKDMYSTKSV